MDLDLDLAPPLALRLIVFCSYESVKSVEGGFTSRASGSADAFADLRLTDGAADANGANGAADAADAAFAAAADSLFRAVALLARAFLFSRISSSRFCFAAAAVAAASCFAASALVAPDISSSNAFLTAGSTDANLTLGHLKLSFSSLAFLNGQS